MTDVTMIVLAVALFAAGFAVGCWWYRRTLKRDPAKLERLAAEAEQLQAKIPPELAAVIERLEVKVKELQQERRQ